MGKGARTRRNRVKDRGFHPPGGPGQFVHLQNPVGVLDQYPQWIFGNACHWETLAMADLYKTAPAAIDTLNARFEAEQPAIGKRLSLALEAIATAGSARFVLDEGEAKGQTLAICGAGVSLKDNTATLDNHDQVWGCNSAAIWLKDHGHKVTHAFTVDQTAEMLNEWRSTPDLDYLLASTVHPNLTELLMARGRRLRFFHNFVGINRPPIVENGLAISFEDWMYRVFFPSTIRCGSGLNSVNRALDVADFMGFDTIDIYGADCCLRFSRPQPGPEEGQDAYVKWLEESVTMHADGGHALASGATMITMNGVIDGRTWLVKPDMIISAVHLVKARQLLNDPARGGRGGRVTFIGDTLPNALIDKPDEYLKRLPSLVGPDGKLSPIQAQPPTRA